jgi:hypothetical protein
VKKKGGRESMGELRRPQGEREEGGRKVPRELVAIAKVKGEEVGGVGGGVALNCCQK